MGSRERPAIYSGRSGPVEIDSSTICALILRFVIDHLMGMWDEIRLPPAINECYCGMSMGEWLVLGGWSGGGQLHCFRIGAIAKLVIFYTSQKRKVGLDNPIMPPNSPNSTRRPIDESSNRRARISES